MGIYLIFSIGLLCVGSLFGFLGFRNRSLFLALASITVISFSLLGIVHSIQVGMLFIEIPLMLIAFGFSLYMLYYGWYIEKVVVDATKDKISKLRREITLVEQDYIEGRVKKEEMMEEIKKLQDRIDELEKFLDERGKTPNFFRFFTRESCLTRELERK